MPAIKQVAPIILKEVMEAAEWAVYTDDKWNWSMVNATGDLSVEIPKRGRFVSFQVMEHVLSQAEMLPGDYFRYLGIVEEARRVRGVPIDGSEDQPRVQ
jgi:hypothetical protein